MILPSWEGRNQATQSTHVYEVRQRSDHRGVDLISDALPFARLWYAGPNAIGYAKFRSRPHDAVVRVYDEAGNVIETPEHAGDMLKYGCLVGVRGFTDC
jgi:hypothetical protein